MGNRTLKESIISSLEINALSPLNENIFYRLIVAADDYGTCFADPVFLARRLFPLKEDITRGIMEDALDQLEQNRLIFRYETDEKGVWLKITTWDRHQRVRNTRRKSPAPKAESAKPAEAKQEEPDPPAAITLPLSDGTEYSVTREEAEEFASLYPGVDVDRELRAMRGWCLNNEKKRKDRAGIRRFVNAWMTRAQDREEFPGPSPGRPPYPDNPYLAVIAEGSLE